MQRLEFHASAANEDDVRRWQREARPANGFSYALSGSVGWLLVGLAGLYTYHAYLNYHSQFAKGTAFIDGHALIARNVILIIDNSGSMTGTEEKIKQLRDRLQSAGISIGAEEKSDGFGFSVLGDATPNALHSLEVALRRNPTADTIYLFSDFDPTNIPYRPDYDDPAGYGRLRELLRQGRRRLYLGTVRDPPRSELMRIARESGGDLIESR